MTITNGHTINFGRTAPSVPVSNIKSSIDFYQNILGMTKVFENGTPISFVVFVRGSAEIHLIEDAVHIISERNLFHLMVDDALSFYEHLITNKVQIIKEIQDADYGLRQFVFADPDGNRIDVGQEL